MCNFLIVLCLFNVVIAAVIPEDKDAKILSYRYKHLGEGEYDLSYNTSNGISRKETGRLVNAGQDNQHIAVVGYYFYTDPDGSTRFYEYTADTNGFHIKSQVNVQERKPGDPGQPKPGGNLSHRIALPLLQSLVG